MSAASLIRRLGSVKSSPTTSQHLHYITVPVAQSDLPTDFSLKCHTVSHCLTVSLSQANIINNREKIFYTGGDGGDGGGGGGGGAPGWC